MSYISGMTETTLKFSDGSIVTTMDEVDFDMMMSFIKNQTKLHTSVKSGDGLYAQTDFKYLVEISQEFNI